MKFHDLHHVLTGYETNAAGEFEILGMGARRRMREVPCGLGHQSRWARLGAHRRTARILAAFVRGRRSRSLYGETFEPLLDQRVGEMRERFIGAQSRATARDVVAFTVTALVGVVVGLAFAAVVLPLVPVGLVAGWLRRREAPHAA